MHRAEGRLRVTGGAAEDLAKISVENKDKGGIHVGRTALTMVAGSS